jgi:hypothetical protein
MTEQEFRQHFIERTNKTTFAVKCEVAAQVFQAVILRHKSQEGAALEAWQSASAFMAEVQTQMEYEITHPHPSRHAVHERS